MALALDPHRVQPMDKRGAQPWLPAPATGFRFHTEELRKLFLHLWPKSFTEAIIFPPALPGFSPAEARERFVFRGH